jgi:hypothetical protein
VVVVILSRIGALTVHDIAQQMAVVVVREETSALNEALANVPPTGRKAR